jgi:4-hydroxy-tetrahydrodipicolinate synthase
MGGKFLQSVKYACELRGRPGGAVRPPLTPMKKELKREVFQIVQTAHTTLQAILAEKG